jgi:hypothetical protein
MSRNNRAPVVVDPNDVQLFVDDLMKIDQFASKPDPDIAQRLALGAQQLLRMTEDYAKEFARRVREKVLWLTLRK